MSARLAPVQEPYAPETAGALRALMGAASELEPLVLFRTIAHHDVLLQRFRQLGASLLSFGRLPAADREVLVHRTTARCGAAYEWGVHAAVFAPATGVDAQRLWSATDPEDTQDPLLVRAADELHDTGALTDATYAALRDRYADDQLVELVCVVGFYHLVSFLCGAFALPPEPWAVPVPG